MELQQGRKRKMSSAAQRFQGLVRPLPPQHPIKCPRCNSLNTKFCYYNNYSLSQPRHFCKACRRYWTRGGACRNIPVGGSHNKKRVSRATIIEEDPIVVASSSTISVETSLHSNVHPEPAVTTSRSSAMPPQPAEGGCMLPSYSSANDGLLSSVIASIPSLNYPQDTFSDQPVINNQLSNAMNSLGTNLGFLQDFDVANLMVSSLNDYGQKLQPVQSFHQDLYTLTGMNTSEAAHQNGGMNSSGGIIGGSSAYPNNDLSFANIPGYGYSSNNYYW